MNFQSKVVESTADLRARAAALTQATLDIARAHAAANAGRIALLKASLGTLQFAGRELNKVARRHVSRFVKENSTFAREAGKDVSALARSTYQQITQRDASPARKPAKTSPRKRAASKRVRAARKAT